MSITKLLLTIFILFPLTGFAQEMTANQALGYWSDRLAEEIPSYSFDYEIDEWASKHNLKFVIVDPSPEEIIQGKYLYKARVGKFKVDASDWECGHHFIALKIWLDKFKQSGSTGVSRESACKHGRP